MKYRKGVVQVMFHEKAKIDVEGIVALVKENSHSLGITPDGMLKYRPPHGERDEFAGGLKNVLQRVSRYVSF